MNGILNFYAFMLSFRHIALNCLSKDSLPRYVCTICLQIILISSAFLRLCRDVITCESSENVSDYIE